MYKKPLPPAQLLHEMLHYDPETGDLRWKTRPHHTCAEGVIDANGSQHGYRVVTVLRVSYLQHRIIWVMQTGEAPPDDLHIDHIDENPGNNRWNNLRLLGGSANVSRSSKFARNPVVVPSGHGTWKAWISGNYMGTFASEDAARNMDLSQSVDRRRNDVPIVRTKLSKGGSSWEARVYIDGKRKHLGTFPTEAQALAAKVPPD